MTAYRASEAGQINHWWADDPRQRFWLEITDRPDIGIDLHCPQRDAPETVTRIFFDLVCPVDDIVFHYEKGEHAITAWSRAAGRCHRSADGLALSSRRNKAAAIAGTRAARLVARWRPIPAGSPDDPWHIRDRAPAVRAVLEALRSRHPRSLYFPFSFYRGIDLGRSSRYLNKLPAEFWSSSGAQPQRPSQRQQRRTTRAPPPHRRLARHTERPESARCQANGSHSQSIQL